MLGHHPKLRRELQDNGQRAFAKVREAHKTHYMESFGTTPAQEVSNTRYLWKLVLRVEPEDEDAFDANVEEFFGADATVEPSERRYQFVVLYDPSDRSKVVIDRSDEAWRMLDVQKFEERSDAQVSRMRERGQGVWADRLEAAQNSMAEYIGTDRSNLSTDEREDALHAQQQKMREIMAGDSAQRAEQIRAIQHDPSVPPEQKAAKIKEVMADMGLAVPNTVTGGQPPTAARTPDPVATGGQPPTEARTPDPVATADALTKLAALHDRGVLTDEEFAAQKKQLLGD